MSHTPEITATDPIWGQKVVLTLGTTDRWVVEMRTGDGRGEAHCRGT